MTAVAVSDVAGVTPAAISQYENGRQSPSPEVMRRISDSLNVPLHRFLMPYREPDSQPIFYRCLSAATKRARQRAERRYEWLKEISNYASRFVRLPDVSYPHFDLPTDPVQIDDQLIEELATGTRRFWGLKDGPISNVVWLLENKGTIVCRSPLEAATLDAFSQWPSAENRPFTVLGSDKSSACRSRHDAAHELGHMILHRFIDKRALSQNDAFGLIEKQAHRFAGAFLLPADSFSEESRLPTLDSLRSLKARWRVSIGGMISRLFVLGLISEEQQKNLRINLGRRRWRTKEPLDDSLEPERPRLLKRCFEMLLEKRVLTPHDVPIQLGLSPQDVEQLAGLNRGSLSDSAMPLKFHGEPDDEDGPSVIPIRAFG